MQRTDLVPGENWGSTTNDEQTMWKAKACDAIIPKPKRAMQPRDTTVCLDKGSYADQFRALVGWSSGTEAKEKPALPMIAICLGSTSRGVVNPGPDTMSVFRFFMPSIQETAECGFRYGVFLGYDVGDKYWDNDVTQKNMQTWFEDNVASSLRDLNIEIKLHLVSLVNTIKKPGPVFTAVTRAAYAAGAQFFYRVNDDSEFKSRTWSSAFTTKLLSLGKPYGVIGPLCTSPGQDHVWANNKILVHDFTHRLHMEIFNQQYYPEELSDWWMDDWITLVYVDPSFWLP